MLSGTKSIILYYGNLGKGTGDPQYRRLSTPGLLKKKKIKLGKYSK